MPREVVITGVGAVSGMGVGAASLWEGVLAGRSSIRPTTRLDTSGFGCRLAAQVESFSARDFVPKHYRKAVKVMARDIELAVAAAKEAVESAGLTTRGSLGEDSQGSTTYRSDRMGCQIGAGLIAAETDELTAALATARGSDGNLDLDRWGGAGRDAAENESGAEGGRIGEGGSAGMENLTPLWLLKYLPNMLACHVTIIHGAEGPSNTITCAHASGLLSLGESMRVIQRGAADLCFSGGAESKLNYMGLLRMELAGRLAETRDAIDPDAVLRPFAPDSRGSLPGEGGGILILEADETARGRGAAPLARLVGFGGGHSDVWSSAEGPDEGYLTAIEGALEDARTAPAEIDMIVPLGCGVPKIDRTEAVSLERVFGTRLASIPVLSIVPAVGDCMAGMSGLQSVVGVRCVQHQVVPAGALVGVSAGAAGRAIGSPRPTAIRNLLVCTPALGGQNAAIVLRRSA
ncbi:MAG: hypothetical protein JNM07_08015 [Phycisphaerae bacterium]|nr:hypothetical protein [Phycisphaerae bacterium]